MDSVLRAVSEIASFREGLPEDVVQSIGVMEIARRTGLPEPVVTSTIHWWSHRDQQE